MWPSNDACHARIPGARTASCLQWQGGIQKPPPTRVRSTMDQPSGPLGAYQDFDEAARAVLGHLRERLPFSSWLITRTEEEQDNWIILQADDEGYGIQPGDVFNWSETYCARMTAGQGPTIAPEADQIPVYREAPIGAHYPIGAYIGFPLRSPEGHLLGTLCAIDPHPQPEEITQEHSTLTVIARLLASLMDAELEVRRQGKQLSRLRQEATRDQLTGANNRRGWEELLAFGEQLCASLGSRAAVIRAHVHGLRGINDTHGRQAGDRHLRRAADILQEEAPRSDYTARLGGADFGLLALECSEAEAQELIQGIQKRFDETDLRATLGYGIRDPHHTLWETKDKADRAVYEAFFGTPRPDPD